MTTNISTNTELTAKGSTRSYTELDARLFRYCRQYPNDLYAELDHHRMRRKQKEAEVILNKERLDSTRKLLSKQTSENEAHPQLVEKYMQKKQIEKYEFADWELNINVHLYKRAIDFFLDELCDHRIAIMMALHSRLGKQSKLAALSEEVFKLILKDILLQ